MTILLEEHFDMDMGPFVVDQGSWQWGLDFGLVNGGVKSLAAWGWISAGDPSWTDYSFEANVMAVPETGVNRAIVLLARYTDRNNYYGLVLEFDRKLVELVNVVAGGRTPIGSVGYPLAENVWYNARIEVRTVGATAELVAYIDGAEVLQVTDEFGGLPDGKVGFYNYNLAEIHFDDVLVQTFVPVPALTINVDRIAGYLGETFAFTGVLTEDGVPLAGVPVYLYRDTLQVGFSATLTDGSYSIPWVADVVGTHNFHSEATPT